MPGGEGRSSSDSSLLLLIGGSKDSFFPEITANPSQKSQEPASKLSVNKTISSVFTSHDIAKPFQFILFFTSILSTVQCNRNVKLLCNCWFIYLLHRNQNPSQNLNLNQNQNQKVKRVMSVGVFSLSYLLVDWLENIKCSHSKTFLLLLCYTDYCSQHM